MAADISKQYTGNKMCTFFSDQIQELEKLT